MVPCLNLQHRIAMNQWNPVVVKVSEVGTSRESRPPNRFSTAFSPDLLATKWRKLWRKFPRQGNFPTRRDEDKGHVTIHFVGESCFATALHETWTRARSTIWSGQVRRLSSMQYFTYHKFVNKLQSF